MATALACTIDRMSYKQPAVAATARATTRQMLTRLFDRAIACDAQIEARKLAPEDASLPSDSSEAAGQTINDAIAAVRDICRLTGGDEAPWLPLKELAPTTGLELVELVLRDYLTAFAERPILLALLRDFVCPLLVRLFRKDRVPASLTVRHMRVVSLVVTHFNETLPNECEMFFTRMVRALESDERMWFRTLVLEVFATFTDNGQKLEAFYRQYDRVHDGRAPLFGEFVRALGSLAQQVVNWKSGSTAQASASLDVRAAPSRLLDAQSAGGSSTTLSTSGREKDSKSERDSELPVTAGQMLWIVSENLCGVSTGIALMVDTKGRAAESRAVVVDMVELAWSSVLAGLSTLMSCIESDAIVQTLLKAHQSMIHAAGKLGLETPRDAFLTSLCNFTLGIHDGNASATPTPAPAPAPTGLLAVLTNVVESTTAVLAHAATGGGGNKGGDANSGGGGGGGGKGGDASSGGSGGVGGADGASGAGSSPNPLTPAQASGMRALLNVAHCFGGELGSRGWFVLLDAMERLDSRLSKSAARLRSADDEQRGNELHILRDALAGVFRSSRSLSRDGLNDLLAALNQLSFPSRFAIATSGGGDGSSRYSMFAIARMVDTTLENLQRIDEIWDIVAKHLVFVFSHNETRIREHGGEALTKIITATFQVQSRAVVAVQQSDEQQQQQQHAGEPVQPSATPTPPVAELADADRQAAALALRMQVPLLRVFEQLVESPHADARERSLQCLHQVLSAAGDVLHSDAWRVVLRTLGRIATSQDSLTSRGFRNLEFVIRDFLALLSLDCIEPLADAIGCYAAQENDLNMSLTAVGLIWDVADNMATRTRADTLLPAVETPQMAPLERLWLVVLEHMQRLGISPIAALRNSALATLFKTVTMHGGVLTPNTWNACLRDVLFPLLVQVKTAASMATSEPANLDGTRTKVEPLSGRAAQMMMHHSRNTVDKQWDETVVVAIDGVADACRRFFGKIHRLAELRAHWAVLMETLAAFALSPAEEVSVAAVRNAFSVLLLHAPVQSDVVTMPRVLWDAAWRGCAGICFALCGKPSTTSPASIAMMVERLEQVVQASYATFTLDDHSIMHDMLHALALFTPAATDLRIGKPSAAQVAIVSMLRGSPPLSADAFEVLLRRSIELLHKALDALPARGTTLEGELPEEVPPTLPLAALCCDLVAHLYERRASDAIRANQFASAVRVTSLASSMRQRFRYSSPIDQQRQQAQQQQQAAPTPARATTSSSIARYHAMLGLWQHGSRALLLVLTSGLPGVHGIAAADASRRVLLAEAWTEALDATEACVIAPGQAERVVIDSEEEDGSSADDVALLTFLVAELTARAETVKLIPERLLDMLLDGAAMRGRRAVPTHCDTLLFRLCSTEHAGAGGVSEHLSQLAEKYAMRRVRDAVSVYVALPPVAADASEAATQTRKHAAVQVCSVLRHLGQLQSAVRRDAPDAFRVPKQLVSDIAPLALAPDDSVRAALHAFLLHLGGLLRR